MLATRPLCPLVSSAQQDLGRNRSNWRRQEPEQRRGRQLKKRLNSLWNVPTFRANQRPPESLVSNKYPSSAEVALDSIPRRKVILCRRSKRVTYSVQSGLTLRTWRGVLYRLITVTNSPMRRSLENHAAVETHKCCCQLSLHARDGG